MHITLSDCIFDNLQAGRCKETIIPRVASLAGKLILHYLARYMSEQSIFCAENSVTSTLYVSVKMRSKY